MDIAVVLKIVKNQGQLVYLQSGE